MALTVQTNNAAMTALKNLNTNSTNMNQSLNRLSSGFRINSAADDASGFAISSKLDAQSSRLKAASQNATQATAMVKMADAGVNEIQNMIGRIQVLATQAASANNAGELGKLDAERVKLESQIDKIANSTNYNGVNLLNGIDAATATAAVAHVAGTVGAVTDAGATQVATVAGTATFATAATATFTVTSTDNAGGFTVTNDVAVYDSTGAVALAAGTTSTGAAFTTATGLTVTIGTNATAAGETSTFATATNGTVAVAAGAATAYAGALAFQVGADNNTNNQVDVNLAAAYTTTALGLGVGDILTQANAQTYIDTAKAAMDTLITQRADLGATQNQMSFVQANLATSIEQSVASVSSIRDADMAAEMANFTKNQILTQAGTSMLAQANQAAQNVLALFR